MKSVWLVLIFIFFADIASAQELEYPIKQSYHLHTDASPIVFTWNHGSEQELHMSGLYGSEECEIYIINNSDRVVEFDSICHADKYPVKWINTSNQIQYAPGDTIKLKSQLTQFYGGIEYPLRVCYTVNNKLEYKEINIKGTLVDSNSIYRTPPALDAKKLEKLKKKNPQNDYYESGKLKSKKSATTNADSIPYRVSYYENGNLKLEEFKRIGLVKKAYDRYGNLSTTWDFQGRQTTYYPNGQIKTISDRTVYYSTEKPHLIYFYENGCLEKEVFAQKTIVKHYHPVICGKLIDHETEKDIVSKTSKGTATSHYSDGVIVGKTFTSTFGSKIELEGEFLEDQLVNGKVGYYSSYGILMFESKISNGERDSLLSKSEQIGKQINLLNEKGQKEGLWITVKDLNLELELTSDYSIPIINTEGFSFRQYIYSAGDTLAQVLLHRNGRIRNYAFHKNKEKRLKAGLPVSLSYYENGFIDTEHFILPSGLDAVVEYSDRDEGQKVGGRRGDSGTLLFENNKLVEIQSKKPEIAQPDWEGFNYVRGNKNYCVAKGTFRNFELYNGFIEYYNSKDERIITEKVTNGAIQYNPKVTLAEPQLKKEALKNDRNFNGWVEYREIKSLTLLKLDLKEENVDKFYWHELDKFKNLEVIRVNKRTYQLADYSTTHKLKQAIKNKEGKPVPRKRDPWDPIIDPPPSDPEPLRDPFIIVDFPEVEAQFPGGTDALFKWIEENAKFPPEITEPMRERVFISFIVDYNGMIYDPVIRKGVNQYLDTEAIRLIKAMPTWIPAIDKGQTVNSVITLPIQFKLH